jgi:hypothetical protein
VRRGRRTLVLIALVAIAPVVASYAAYYWLPRDKHVNYGELLATPAPDVAGTVGAQPFRMSDLRGKWVLAMASPGACDAKCTAALYAMRQARTIQGKEMSRVARTWWIIDDATPAPALLAEHPDLIVVRARDAAFAAWPAGDDRVYLLDPLGNLVLAYPRDPDIKALAKDLTRLLKASRIG